MMRLCMVALLALALAVSACASDSDSGSSGGSSSGGSSGGSSSGGSTGSSSNDYLVFTNSGNGEWVLDASNDTVHFLVSTRRMVFGSTTYSNTYLDSNAYFYVDNVKVAGVYYVLGSSGGTVTAMVCTNGQVMDMYGWETSLQYTCYSGVTPTYTLSDAPGGSALGTSPPDSSALEGLDTPNSDGLPATPEPGLSPGAALLGR